jgi:2-polyprenyl-3-methyl-5-hydroxy-6-metoxy-1,4-benzoquinol methylase
MSVNDDEFESENPFGLDTDSDFQATRRNITISLIKKYSDEALTFRILDVGCGKGNITRSINQSIPNASIDAFDISAKAIVTALKAAMNINFFQADALTFKGFGYLYDIIILNNIYEHVENPVGLLINLKHFLTDNGAFIISTPNRYYIKNVLRKLFGLRIIIPKYHVTEYSIGQIYDHHLYANLIVENVVIPDFKREEVKITDIVIFKIIQPILDAYLKLLKSRTRLGSLLFVVSKKMVSSD